MSGQKFYSLFVLSFGRFHTEKLFQLFYRLYLGQKTAGEAIYQWGPNTHEDPHNTVAARKVAQPLFVKL